MTPRTKLIAATIAVLACSFFVWRSVGSLRGPATDTPRGTLWVCTDPACGGEFSISVADLGAFYEKHADGTPPCPRCSKTTTARAITCPQCGKAIPKPARSASKNPPVCPKCGKALK